MTTAVLRNVWYMAALSSQIERGNFFSTVICNEPVLLVRKSSGELYALKDICPHRGIPFSFGQVVKDEVECPYHGWTFNSQGVCTLIPSLCTGQDLDCRKIKVKSYPLKEQQGVVWIFIGEKDFDPSSSPAVPWLEALDSDTCPNVVAIEKFSCHVDHAVIGLMDPAHGPYVHKSWLWRSSKTAHEKTKKFGPTSFGFQMLRHPPSKNSKAYKILGGAPTTEITFTLPSVRVEHIQVGKWSVYSLTGLTPISEKETRIHQLLYWNHPLLSVLKPFVKSFTHFFLNQDIDAVNKQQEGLKFDPSLMLIRDADTQAKWYYALKDEWLKKSPSKEKFENPVPFTELRWRS